MMSLIIHEKWALLTSHFSLNYSLHFLTIQGVGRLIFKDRSTYTSVLWSTDVRRQPWILNFFFFHLAWNRISCSYLHLPDQLPISCRGFFKSPPLILQKWHYNYRHKLPQPSSRFGDPNLGLATEPCLQTVNIFQWSKVQICMQLTLVKSERMLNVFGPLQVKMLGDYDQEFWFHYNCCVLFCGQSLWYKKTKTIKMWLQAIVAILKILKHSFDGKKSPNHKVSAPL